MEVSLLQVGSALVINAGFCWLFGAWFGQRWLPAPHAGRRPARRSANLWAAGLIIIASCASLWAATAVMAGEGLGAAASMVPMMVTSTSYGHAGAATLAISALVFALELARRSILGDALVLAALVIFAVVRASMGHAGEAGWWSLAMAAESLHLLAIALWTGAVWFAAWHALEEETAGKLNGPQLHSYLHAMSTAAMLAVAAIAATGLYSAWHRIGSTVHLVHSVYGMTLLGKLAFVALALAMGGYNKFYGLPAVARNGAALGTVRLVLRIEAVVLLGVLAAAAVLTSLAPPSTM